MVKLNETEIREYLDSYKPEDFDILVRMMSLDFIREIKDRINWSYFLAMQINRRKDIKKEFERELEPYTVWTYEWNEDFWNELNKNE